MRLSRFSHALIIGSVVLASPGIPAQQAGAGQVRSATINLRNADIQQVAEQVSRLTGRTIVLDPNVKGRVSVVSARPLGPQGIWDLFQSVLRVQGFTAVQSGGIWRIVPQSAAVQGGSRVVAGRGGRTGEIVTRTIRLGALPSADAVRILRPLISQFGSIEASTRPNAVIITDYAENIQRLVRVVQGLDSGGGEASTSFQSIPIGNASAEDVGQAIQRILGDEASGGPKVAVDPSSNVVLVRGSPAALREARRVASLLDRPRSATLTTRVFRLRFSDAEMISAVLNGLLGGGGAVAKNPVARSLSEQKADPPIGAGNVNRFDSVPTAAQLTERISNTPAAVVATSAGADVAIQAAPELNAIVVRGSPAAIAQVAALIDELDVRRPQVTIEAAIVEITGDVAEQLGVQLGLGAAAQLGTSGGTSFSNAGLSLSNILAAIGAPRGAVGGDGVSLSIGSRGDFNVLVQALGQSSNANLLSTPSLTTLDNQPAEIVVGQNVPFRTGSFSTEGNSRDPFTTIEREDVGITLRVVPRIHEGDVVQLEVSQEVSSLINGTVPGAADLITNRRSIKTTVLADDGETIVLGGLITDDRLSSRSKVPVLGDIPVVGALFRSRRENQTKRTLFLFLRPTILRGREDVAAEAESRYSRLRGEELLQEETKELLAKPPGPRLPVKLKGVY